MTVAAEHPADGEAPWTQIPDTALILLRHLSDHEFALMYINLADKAAGIHSEFVDMGIPVTSGVALDMTDVFSGEHIGKVTDFYTPHIAAHDCRLFLCKLVPCHE